jgi:hypothetical protein
MAMLNNQMVLWISVLESYAVHVDNFLNQLRIHLQGI